MRVRVQDLRFTLSGLGLPSVISQNSASTLCSGHVSDLGGICRICRRRTETAPSGPRPGLLTSGLGPRRELAARTGSNRSPMSLPEGEGPQPVTLAPAPSSVTRSVPPRAARERGALRKAGGMEGRDQTAESCSLGRLK